MGSRRSGTDFRGTITPHAPVIIPEPLDGLTLLLWLRADSPTSVTKNGSNQVASWADESGASAGPFAESTDSEKPIWVDAVYNGKPTLRGSGTTCSLTTTVATSLGTSASIFFALKKGSVANTYEIADTTGSNSSIISNFTTTKVEWFNGADRYQLSLAATGLHIYCVTQVNGGALIGYLDGVQVFSQTAAVALTNIKYLFGLNNTSGTNGDIPEIVVAANVVSSAKRNAITNYLGTKYGVAIS